MENVTRGEVVIVTDGTFSNIQTGDSVISHSWINGSIDRAQLDANAQLITEAFNVHNETGLSPNELREQNVELLDMVRRFCVTSFGNDSVPMEIKNAAKDLLIKYTKP